MRISDWSSDVCSSDLGRLLSSRIPNPETPIPGPVRGTLFIVAAPSGAGKSSIVNACLARDPNVCLSISYTSREPRPGERHAEHYNFISREEFARMIDAGDFFAHALVHERKSVLEGTGVVVRVSPC